MTNTTTVSMVYVWFDKPAIKTFAFTFTAGPAVKFSFDKLLPPSRVQNRRSFKRRRPLWDVDGGSSEAKKKRRLRLNLITSRLSRPFSVPATNIVDRGFSRIAIWARGRRLDKNVLRKAAIMNRVRTRLDTAKATAQREQASRQTYALQQVMAPKPRFYDPPLPPSPLGLSNYDALDIEDEILEDDEHGEHSSSIVYSDFNVMDPTRAVDGDNYDYLDELDGIPHEMPEERPPPPPDERLFDMLREKELQKDICFEKFIA